MAKSIGVTFSVAANLALGKEGPMVHIGSIIAAGIGQGKSTSLRWINTSFFHFFRNDLEKRECVNVKVFFVLNFFLKPFLVVW